MSAPPELPTTLVPFTTQDHENLKLLGIFYWVIGAMGIFTALGLGIYLISMGVFVGHLSSELAEVSDVMPWVEHLPWIIPFLVVIGGVILVLGLLGSIGKILCGNFIRKQTKYNYCLFVAVLTCLSMPLGTILGIFTFSVLRREQVKRAFKTGEPPLPMTVISPAA